MYWVIFHMSPYWQAVGALKRTADNIKDPLFRFFEREVNLGARLLHDIRQDLQDVMLICQADKKPTNHHRSMMADLSRGTDPVCSIQCFILFCCNINLHVIVLLKLKLLDKVHVPVEWKKIILLVNFYQNLHNFLNRECLFFYQLSCFLVLSDWHDFLALLCWYMYVVYVLLGCRYYPSVVEKIHSTPGYHCDPVDHWLLPQSETAPGHCPDHPTGGHQGTEGMGHYRGQHHVTGSLQGSTSGHYRCQHFGHYTSNIIKGHYRGQLQYHMNLYGHYRGSKSSHLINMYMYMKISEMLDIHEDSTSGSFCCAVWPR